MSAWLELLAPLPWAFYLPTMAGLLFGLAEYDKPRGWWRRPLLGWAVQLLFPAAVFLLLSSGPDPDRSGLLMGAVVVLFFLHFVLACYSVLWAGRSWAIMGGLSWWCLTQTAYLAFLIPWL